MHICTYSDWHRWQSVPLAPGQRNCIVPRIAIHFRCPAFIGAQARLTRSGNAVNWRLLMFDISFIIPRHCHRFVVDRKWQIAHSRSQIADPESFSGSGSGSRNCYSGACPMLQAASCKLPAPCAWALAAKTSRVGLQLRLRDKRSSQHLSVAICDSSTQPNLDKTVPLS